LRLLVLLRTRIVHATSLYAGAQVIVSLLLNVAAFQIALSASNAEIPATDHTQHVPEIDYGESSVSEVLARVSLEYEATLRVAYIVENEFIERTPSIFVEGAPGDRRSLLGQMIEENLTGRSLVASHLIALGCLDLNTFEISNIVVRTG
jgi:hypothetical protein